MTMAMTISIKGIEKWRIVVVHQDYGQEEESPVPSIETSQTRGSRNPAKYGKDTSFPDSGP
jgi:hypothetical protein